MEAVGTAAAITACLNSVGWWLKRNKYVPNFLIPFILFVLGVGAGVVIELVTQNRITFSGFTVGMTAAFGSVFLNQAYRQVKGVVDLVKIQKDLGEGK
jgi:hypothetical protein